MNAEKLICKGKLLKSCSKHNRFRPNSASDKIKMHTHSHIPTVRCHEETMSKLSPTCADFGGDSDDFHNKFKELKKTKNKHRKNKGENVGGYLIITDRPIRETSSAPVDNRPRPREKCTSTVSKSKRSKSIPPVPKPNLENSVEFIPVKLSSNNEDKKAMQNKQDATKKEKCDFRFMPQEKTSESYRATWEQLLKAGNQNVYHTNNIDNEVIPNLASNNEYNFTTHGASKKKISISVSNDNHQNNVLHPPQNHKDSVKPLHTGTSFFISDPVKTLDFLIKQLREKLKKQENDNLQRIIIDMENALLKISVQNEGSSKHALDENKYNKTGSPLNNMPEKDASNGIDFKVSNGCKDVNKLQRDLEKSCLILQSLCIKQMERCNNHNLEKEQLALQLAESRRLLAIAKSKEKDYEVIIGDLRLKIQETNTQKDQEHQMIQELSDTVAKLREENQMLRTFRDSVNKLNVCLKEISSEKDILQSKLHVKELEIEKLKVLLRLRENQPPTLNNKKNENYEEYINQEVNIKIPLEDKDNSILSLSTDMSWTHEKLGLVCSSQASSSPRHSPSPYNSWQHISSIYHRPSAASDINKGIVDFFENLKMDMNQNQPPQVDLEMPSSANSCWSYKEEDDTN